MDTVQTMPNEFILQILEARSQQHQTSTKNYKACKDWDLSDILIRMTPWPLGFSPPNSNLDFMMHLLQPPAFNPNVIDTCPFQEQFQNYFTHGPIPLLHSEDVRVPYSSPTIYVLEKILDPLRPFSHAFIIEWEKSNPIIVKSITITFDCKNGPSDMVRMDIPKYKGSVEKLYQGSKAAFFGQYKKALEIMGCDNGLGAHFTASHRNFTLTSDETNRWNEVSLQRRMEIKLCTLADKTFHKWIKSLNAFLHFTGVNDPLFLKVGSGPETCGMMGNEILQLIKDGKQHQLVAQFGQHNQAPTRNIDGFIMTKLLQWFREGESRMILDWSQLVGIETLFRF